MDSEDDVHDVDSLDEDYYSGDAMDSYDDDGVGCEFVDNNSADSGDLSANRQQKNYTILTEEDIRQWQEDDITRVSAVLSISRDSACMLLCFHNWNVNKLHEEWFANEDRVRKTVGLLDRPVVRFRKGRELVCGICFETYPPDTIIAAACGHPFCNTCWTAYISTSINDGPGCLTLICPALSCGAAVGVDMVNMVTSDKDKEKYRGYLLRSYIEDNRKTKWCPAPGCDCAVEFVIDSERYDVSCLCSYSFCWNCTENAHRPVDCDTVSKWIFKNSSESENVNWILANSKPCPKCKRPIEKNKGCMHMTCRFEFCWLCLGAWRDHGGYACNRYEATKQDGTVDEAEQQREMAKKCIERYTHYYERWATNHSLRQKALADLHQMQTVHLEKLSKTQCEPETLLKFIIEAWLQIVECRRIWR